MWKRHVPIWQSMMKREVSYVPAWTNVNEFGVSTKKTDPDVIKIGMMDYWRLTREPFSFFPAIDMLRKISGKKVEVNVWGLCEDPSKTYEAVMQWLVKDEVVKIRGRTMRPMDDIFHQNDFILSMSTEETRVIRESFSCGVPVVCGRGGSLPFTDYSCDAVDSELMAQTMLRCHDDMCKNEEKMRVDLRKYAEKNFNVENAAREIIKIFNKTMKEHGSINHPKITGKIRPVASVNDTAEKLKERLSDPMKTTAYVRFGDGELLFMDNAIKTGGMHHNSPELRDELIKAFTFKQDGYLVSSAAGIINEGKMRRGLFANFGGEVDEAMLRVVKKFKMNKSTLDNYIALAYKSVFEPEWFVDFLKKCIHGKKVLFVGGEDLCRSPMIKRVFNVDSFVELPMVDAYYSLDEKKMREIQLAVQNNDVTLCAAGMCAKVIAYRIWSSKLKKNFVDIGSIADAVAGIKNTRTWIGIVGEDYRKNYENVFMSKRTDIVILTYKNEEKTIRCFEAIAKNTENYRVIWVDNGSGDESIEKVTPAAKKLEDCEIVKNKENLGFTKGVNQALRKIMMDRSSDYVALVNNDVVVTRGWKDDMIASVLLNELAAVGPVTSENNPHSISALRGVVSDLPVFQNETDDERALVLKSKFGTKILISDNMISFFCCMMRREMVEQVGLLDEGFFAYGEDNDYFERMKRLNMKFGIALGCYVHHDHGVTSDLFGKDWANKRKNEAKQRLYEKWEKNKPTKSSS
jgi:GT2 family glycosyltransferase